MVGSTEIMTWRGDVDDYDVCDTMYGRTIMVDWGVMLHGEDVCDGVGIWWMRLNNV